MLRRARGSSPDGHSTCCRGSPTGPMTWCSWIMIRPSTRLLRPGGALVLGAALAGGRVTDPAIRDPETVVLREVVKALRDSDEWTPALLPIGEGLLCAARSA